MIECCAVHKTIGYYRSLTNAGLSAFPYPLVFSDHVSISQAINHSISFSINTSQELHELRSDCANVNLYSKKYSETSFVNFFNYLFKLICKICKYGSFNFWIILCVEFRLFCKLILHSYTIFNIVLNHVFIHQNQNIYFLANSYP